jgi:hypothetical protein
MPSRRCARPPRTRRSRPAARSGGPPGRPAGPPSPIGGGSGSGPSGATRRHTMRPRVRVVGLAGRPAGRSGRDHMDRRQVLVGRHQDVGGHLPSQGSAHHRTRPMGHARNGGSACATDHDPAIGHGGHQARHAVRAGMHVASTRPSRSGGAHGCWRRTSGLDWRVVRCPRGRHRGDDYPPPSLGWTRNPVKAIRYRRAFHEAHAAAACRRSFAAAGR